MRTVTFVAGYLGLAVTAAAIAQVLETPLTSAQYSASRLVAAQPTAVAPFQVDQITTVTVRVVSSSVVRTTILSPDQQTITPENVGTFAGTYASVDSTGPSGPVPVPGLNLSGYVQLYSFPAPGLGEYQLQHQAVGAVTSEIAVLAIVEVASSMRSALVLSSTRVPIGSAVAAGVALFHESTPLVGANIQSSLTGPDGVPQALAFVDSGQSPDHAAGDGLHSARFVPGVAGRYIVSATASGTLGPGQPYRRQMATRIEVTPRDIYFASSAVTITPVDLDSNGRIDRLDVSAQIRADRATRFHLDLIWSGPTLESGGAGMLHEEVLGAGTFSFSVQIPAGKLLDETYIGVPFQIERISLFQFTGDESWLTDEITNGLPGFGPFTPLQLERPPIWIRSLRFDPENFDADPAYEFLRGTAQIYVTQSGLYSWRAEIGPFCWPSYFVEEFTRTLSSTAENVVVFHFSGTQIGQSGFDGPFRLDQLSIYRPGASYSSQPRLIGAFGQITNDRWESHTVRDCNNNGRTDGCDIGQGSLDCNGNRIPDECDPDCDFDGVPNDCDPPGDDCDNNGRPDYCDRDCGGDGFVDACEQTTQFLAQRTFACPAINCAMPGFALTNVPAALSDVTLSFSNGYGDFNTDSEFLTIRLNGQSVGTIFGPGGVDCGSMTETLIVPRAAFNAVLSGGNLTITAEAPPGVNPAQCPNGWSVQLNLTYAEQIPDVCILGDMNCNGVINVSDVGPFVSAITDRAVYERQFVRCNYFNGDMNGNGVVNVADIGIFVALLGQ